MTGSIGPQFTITTRITTALTRIERAGCTNRANLSFGRAFGLRMEAMAEPILYPRFARSRLEEALDDTPVVLVHGPHQCGKITLARMVENAAGCAYSTFDDNMSFHLV